MSIHTTSLPTLPQRIMAIIACVLLSISTFVVPAQHIAYAEDADDFTQTTSHPDVNTVVKAGVFAFDGYHMMDDDGDLYGYGIDVLDMISRYSHLVFDEVAFSAGWSDMLDMLRNGEIDLVTSASRTPEREAEFDFSLPIGRKGTVLSTLVTNDKFTPGDFDAYNGMLVGEIADNSQNEIFDEFARDHGFTYSVQEFADEASLTQALQQGQVDTIVTSSLRKTNNEKTLETVEENDFYVIVRKGETELLSEINYAIEQMNIAEGDWQNILHYKYYGPSYSNAFDFTEREREYIEQVKSGKKHITVTAFTDNRPYVYMENGTPTGILMDYFNDIMADAGLTYEFIAPESYEEYVALIDGGKVDIVLDWITSSNYDGYSHENTFSTSPIMVTSAVQLSKNDTNTVATVAVPVSPASMQMKDKLSELFNGMSLQYYPDREAALQAVKDGAADAAYVYMYTAQDFINHDMNSDLTSKTIYGMDVAFSVMVSDKTDHELVNILEKTIQQTPASTLNEIIGKYMAYNIQELPLAQYLISNPMLCAVLVLIILLIVAVIIILMVKIKSRERLRKTAQRANDAKTRFLNSVSHDIRTPMNSIIGFTSLATAHLDDTEKVGEYLSNIRISSDHLLRLINDVLDLSRIESGKVKMNPAPDSIEQIMDSLTTIVISDVEDKGLEFSMDLSGVQDDVVICDSLRLNQILLNIISNAVKYTESGGSVSVSVRETRLSGDDNRARYSFSVSDTGIGMSEEFVKQVFEPFAREETATVSGIQGTGLGLAITKSLVELMDGDITVESEVGVGSTFTVTFDFKTSDEKIEPRTAKSEGERIKDALSNAKEVLEGKHILMAEDNMMSREIASTILEDVGIILDAVEDGKYAVEKMKEMPAGTYDLVLTDMQMPIMNGIETVKAIRALDDPEKNSVPIIVCTANVFEEDKEAVKDIGFNGYITKPIEIDKLLEAIEKLSVSEAKQDGTDNEDNDSE